MDDEWKCYSCPWISDEWVAGSDSIVLLLQTVSYAFRRERTTTATEW